MRRVLVWLSPCTERSPMHGFTLVEVLVAMAIIAVALLGAAGTIGMHAGGLGASLPVAHAALTRGQLISTATFLAQARLEQVRRLEYAIGPPSVDQIGAGAPPAVFPDEEFGTIPGHHGFRREVTVEGDVPAEHMKTVTVTVRFRVPGAAAVETASVTLATLLAARPE